MVFEQIEQLKRQYTDKYVVVDPQRPELRRFHGQTGQIKTVNMSGRALVQFDGDNNSGWYDIDLQFLQVVPPPPPKEDKKTVARKSEKPAVENTAAAVPELKKAATPEPAPKSATPSAPAIKASTADILAAARVKQASGDATTT